MFLFISIIKPLDLLNHVEIPQNDIFPESPKSDNSILEGKKIFGSEIFEIHDEGKCHLCSLEFGEFFRGMLNSHLKSVHWICPKTLKDISEEMKPKTYCFICNRNFGNSLKIHNQHDHSNEVKEGQINEISVKVLK